MPAPVRQLFVLVLTACLVGCAASGPANVYDPGLQTVAEFPGRQVTGVTVSETGRVFVNFPYWAKGQAYQGAVAEVLPDGTVRSYPDPSWNAWRIGGKLDPASHFVCVQSVVADGAGGLWVLDPAAPMMGKTVTGGPKLVRIDLASNTVSRVIPVPAEIAPRRSYLNDVRIDRNTRTAYITDSGLGAIVVVDLDTGTCRRLLASDDSTRSENLTPIVGGRPLLTASGQPPKIHSDGIALSGDGEYLYYHALIGRTLYRVPTAVLRDPSATEQDVAGAVRAMGPDVVSDGILMGPNGRVYLTALEYDAVVRRLPGAGAEQRAGGKLPGAGAEIEPVVVDPRLRWPDTLAIGPGRAGEAEVGPGRGLYLYVTASQIHLQPQFNGGKSRVAQPYGVYRVMLPDADG